MQKRLFSARIYGHLVRMSLRSMMQYRADFWTSMVGVLVLNGANLAQIGIVSWKFGTIGTWTAGDLMLLYGLYMVCYSVYSIFFGRVAMLENEVMQGTFDKYLVRPVNAFVQFLGGEIKYVGTCDTLLGIGLIWFGKSLNGVAWGAVDYLWLAVFVVSGGTLIVCIRLILACAAFWVVKASALQSMMMQAMLLTQKYPVSIFGDVFRAFVTGIIPIAFMNYYPAIYLLRKGEAPMWLSLLSPAIAFAFVALAALVWKRGVARYGSAGG